MTIVKEFFILLKVVLLAYSRGLISSRKIEQACRENVVFMALACGQRPDHSTIAAFVSSMKDEILPLFRDVLLVCEEMNLLGGTMLAPCGNGQAPDHPGQPAGPGRGQRQEEGVPMMAVEISPETTVTR